MQRMTGSRRAARGRNPRCWCWISEGTVAAAPSGNKARERCAAVWQ
jgi:hypothetical protein